MQLREDYLKPEWSRAFAEFGVTQAVRIGKTIYLSGTVSCGDDFAPIHVGDFRAQFDYCYKVISETLAHFRLAPEHIVKETIFSTDIKILAENMDIRKRFYGDGPFPASTAIEVTRLFFPELLVEIEVTVVEPEN